MKRLLALVLSMVFLLTALPLGAVSVAAEEYPYLQEGVITEAERDFEGYSRFCFTPAESGWYVFRTMFEQYDGWVATDVYDMNWESIDGSNEQDTQGNVRVGFNAIAGETYWLMVSSDAVFTPVYIAKEEPRTITNVEYLDDTVLLEDIINRAYVPKMCVTYSDGTVEEICSLEFSDDVEYYFAHTKFSVPTYQWEVGGTYTATASLSVPGVVSGLMPGDFTVTVVDTPIASVEIAPITILKEGDGYWYQDWVYDEETGTESQGPQYFYYQNTHPNNVTIILKDGTVIENTHFQWNGREYYLSAQEQNYENRLLPGVNERTYSIAGYEGTYTIHIVDTPVASVEIEPITLIENYDGEWNTSWVWDSELGYVEGPEYFYYYNGDPKYDDVTITLTDGTVIRGREFEWNGENYYLNTQGQNYENRLLPGENVRTYSIAGYEGTYTVNIVENPVVSVEIDPITVIENYGGYWDWDWTYNEETGEETQLEYFCYDDAYPYAGNPRITLKDGRVIEGEGFDWNGVHFSLDYDYQNYENRLLFGENERHFSIAGYEGSYVVNVIESPVAAVEVLDTIRHTEYSGGDWYTRWIYDEETGREYTAKYYKYNTIPEKVKVTLKDGSSFTSLVYSSPDMWGQVWNGQWYPISFGGDQSSHPWGVGMHTATASLMGFTFTYSVEILPALSEDVYEYVDAEGGVIITGCYKPEPTMEIPATIDGKAVIGVADLGENNIIHLTLPDSVQFIGECLLNRIRTVSFGAGMKNLTPEHFKYAYDLQSIAVSSANPYYTVEDGVLYDKAMTTFMAYPMGGGNRDYAMPATVTNMDALSMRIYDELNLILSEDHPDIVVVDGVTYNKDMTRVLFCDKDKEGVYVMPATVTGVNEGAFRGCTGLTEVSIAPGVTSIVYRMFEGCEGLQVVNLPEGLVSIEDAAFSGAYNLSNVNLPATLTVIGDNAFDNCNALADVTLPEGLVSIGDYAFDYTSITSVTLPASVEYVGDGAFAWTQLSYLDLGKTVQYIGGGAFADANIESVVIPDSVTTLGSYAFGGCGQLTDVVVGAGVTCIDDGTFAGCPIENIDFRGPVTTLGQSAFTHLQMTSLVLPSSVTEIMYMCFAGAENLEEIHYNGTLTRLNAGLGGAWYDKQPEGLVQFANTVCGWKGDMAPNTALTIPEGLTLLADGAFDTEENIASVYLPDSMEMLGQHAFVYNTNLTSVRLGDNVKEIRLGVFRCCPNLTDVYYTGSEADRAAIAIEDYNDPLLNATWHYNICQEGAHVYENWCDNTCNQCDWVRPDAPGHTYRNDCDTDCDNCGLTRTPPHKYSDVCDAVCNGCGLTREPPHQYADKYDTDCDLCGAVREVSAMIGDANGDGKINIRDLGLIQQHLNGWSVSISLDAADVTGDGKVNVRDLGLIQQYLNGWNVELG